MRRFELLDDPLHLALPRAHPLAGRKRVALGDLREEPWVQTSAASPCAKHVIRSCHAAGFEPSVSFESDDYQTVQGLVAAGVGVALIPELALSTVREDIVVRALRPRQPGPQGLRGDPRAAAVTPAVATMLDVLREAPRAAPATSSSSVPETEPPPGGGGGGSGLRRGAARGRPRQAPPAVVAGCGG